MFEPLVTGVAKLWLNTQPELDLLDGIWPGHAPAEVIGEGIPVPESYDPAGFRARHGLPDRPFALYGGRREGAKNWDAQELAADNSAKLVLDLIAARAFAPRTGKSRSSSRPA